jgi:hypothetical protein
MTFSNIMVGRPSDEWVIQPCRKVDRNDDETGDCSDGEGDGIGWRN